MLQSKRILRRTRSLNVHAILGTSFEDIANYYGAEITAAPEAQALPQKTQTNQENHMIQLDSNNFITQGIEVSVNASIKEENGEKSEDWSIVISFEAMERIVWM